MKTISLRQFNIKRPEKLHYFFAISDLENLIQQLQSKSLKSYLGRTDEIFKQRDIVWEYKELTKQDFLNWLPYYKQKMEELEYDVRADEQWYKEETEKGYKIKGFFFHQHGKIIGSSIVALKDNVASFAFKASDRIKMPKFNFGALIEFIKLREMIEEENISMVVTRSRNAFGVFNTSGYLDLRLRFGYVIRPNLDSQLLDEVPIDDNKGSVLFFGLQNEEFVLFALQKESEKGKGIFDTLPFSSSKIPLREIYYK